MLERKKSTTKLSEKGHENQFTIRGILVHRYVVLIPNRGLLFDLNAYY